MKRYIRWMIGSLFLLICLDAAAAISVRDDAGNNIVLQQPAQRIVTLAPHTTEMVFAAGGGNRIVGTVSYSDFPPAARRIPLVGDNRQIDIERVIAVRPDLLVVWRHSSSERQLEPLRKLGIPLFYSEPHKLDDIPNTLIRLGQLMGTQAQAEQSAANLRRKIADLEVRYRNRPVVRVFYQVWGKPLYTLNGNHIVSDVIRLCGGANIFASLPIIAPTVTVESVLLQNPEAIISGESRTHPSDGLAMWKQYPALLATQRGNLFAVDADLMNRPGPRIIDGAAEMCEKLDQARSHRKEGP
jgi:iron complex transport system substrate-binding protein